MRVICRSGHLGFYPNTAGEIARFANFFKVRMKREEDYFTFEGLYGAPKYSLLGKQYLNLPATKTAEGHPWDVMRENGFVYHIGLGVLVPKATILGLIELPLVGFYYRAGGALLQPGTRSTTGNQIMSYSGEYIENGASLRVSEYSYE